MLGRFFWVFLVGILALIGAACAQQPEPTPAAATPVPVVGPILVVAPFGPSVSVLGTDTEWYALEEVSREGATGVLLPEGYRIPQRIRMRGTRGSMDGKSFLVLFGPGELPVNPDRILRVPLTEEMRVGPLREGLTQILFEEAETEAPAK